MLHSDKPGVGNSQREALPLPKRGSAAHALIEFLTKVAAEQADRPESALHRQIEPLEPLGGKGS
jgi:hypothetical protein